MRFDRVFCAIFFLIVLHLSFFASSSTLERSLSDDIRSGISLAGKIFGIDSPSNIAAVSNIAELVARAFSNNRKNSNNNDDKHTGWYDRNSIEKQPNEKLENLDEDTNPQDNNIDDSVIVGTSINTGTGTSNGVDYGFLGQVLRILGMDTNKIGALAINGIIFIAQIIGRSFLSAFTNMAGDNSKPNDGIDTPGQSRQYQQSYREAKPRSIFDNAFDWIFEQSKMNPILSQYITTMLEKSLPENIAKLIDDNNGNFDLHERNTECIKLLICKSAPIIWGMQRAVSQQFDGTDNETHEMNENSSNDEGANNEDRINVFFKSLPSVEEFKVHGDACEEHHSACKIF